MMFSSLYHSRWRAKSCLVLLLLGCAFLGLSACSYGWKQAVQDANRPARPPREKALQFFVDYLAAQLGKEGDAKRRKIAIQSLGATQLPRAVNTLRAVLMHESDASLRKEAIRALAQLRAPQALQELQTALKDRDIGVRMTAAAALGRLGDKRALRSLINALRDPKAPVRASAVSALAELKVNVAIPYLIPALSDPDPSVTQAAENALLKIGVPALSLLIREMCKPTSPRRLRIAVFLPRYGRQITDTLIQAFKQSQCRDIAISPLIRVTGDQYTWSLLRKLIKNPPPASGKSVVGQLNRVGSFYTVKGILRLWYQIPVGYRVAMRRVLGESASRGGEPALVLLDEAAKSGNDMAYRSTAILAMGNVGQSAVSKLRFYTQIRQRVLRLSAIRALGKTGKAGVPSLVTFLGDQDEEVRLTAIVAASNIKDARVVDQLIPQLQHPAAKVRIAVLQGLRKQEDRRAILPIRRLLKDPINNVVINAIQALLDLGDQQNINLYIAALKHGPYPPEPSYVKTLGKLGDRDIIPLLRKVIKRYLVDWKSYMRKADRLYRRRLRAMSKQMGRVPQEQREQTRDNILRLLATEPARSETALCSFTEALRALLRLNVRVFSQLRKRGYRHSRLFNPLRKAPAKCPWPSLSVVGPR